MPSLNKRAVTVYAHKLPGKKKKSAGNSGGPPPPPRLDEKKSADSSQVKQCRKEMNSTGPLGANMAPMRPRDGCQEVNGQTFHLILGSIVKPAGGLAFH